MKVRADEVGAAKLAPAVMDDPGWRAALFLMAHMAGRGQRWFSYVRKNGINKAALRRASGPWSSTERLMLAFTLDLHAGGDPKGVSLGQAAATLDDGNMRAVLDAVRVYRDRGTVAEVLRKVVAALDTEASDA